MENLENDVVTPSSPSGTLSQSTAIGFKDVVTEDLSRELTTELICTVCPQPGDLRCSVCGLRYCSAQCQRLDRCTHKFFCKSLDRFTDDKRPSPHHVRAILFPEDKKNPEWTWVLTSEDRASICLSHLHENLPTDVVSTIQFKTYRDKKTSRMPHHWLTKFTLYQYQTNSGNHFSSINKSVLNLGPPGHLQTYYGPILVVAGKKESRNSGPQHGADMSFHTEDLEMVDVWQVFQEMLYGDGRTPCVINIPRYPFNSIPAVKVNCFGDRARFHPDKDPRSNAAIFEAVTVPNREMTSEMEQWPSLLAFMLGLPWLCRVVHNSEDLWVPGPDGRLTPDPVATTNDELGLFHISLKRRAPEQQLGTQGPTAGQAPGIMVYPVLHYGSIILVHMYGRPIRPEHVRMANLFSEEKGFARLLRRRDLLWSSGINLTQFNRYWHEKARDNDVPGMDLRGVSSPMFPEEYQLPVPEECIENLAEYETLFVETASNTLNGPSGGAA